MSNIQGIDSIAPMAEQSKQKSTGKAVDPVQVEYEEGKRFLGNGNLSQAAIAFHNVLLAREEAKDEEGIANACNQLGNVCMEREEYEQARKHYQRAWEICEKLFDEMSMMALRRQFLKIHRGLEEWDEAIGMCLDLLEIYRSNRDPAGSVSVMEEMASLYVAAGNKERAADVYRTVASIHDNYNHKKIAADFIKKAEALEHKA